MSTSGPWRRSSDWYHPAVDAVVAAVTTARRAGDDAARDGPAPALADAADRLGTARGHSGVGIGETIDDLACLFQVIGLEPDLAVLRALSVGWAAGADGAAVAPGVRDPMSGLATDGYFAQRLAEVYCAADREHVAAAELAALLVLDAAEPAAATPAGRMVGAATLGRALIGVFGAGHPMAALGRGHAVVLVGPPADDADRCSREASFAFALHNCGLGHSRPHARILPLPESHALAVELLHTLRR